MSEQLPVQSRPSPPFTADTQFWWDGVADKKLLIQRCLGCKKLRHPPGPLCPTCHSLDWDTIESSGRGEIYSFVTLHHPPIPPFEYPNVIVLVELEEGTRVVSNLPGVAPDEVEIGQRVQAYYADLEKGRTFLQFERVAQECA